ncbi:DUF5937 family protein [Streptomyces qinglanensis]|uniref:ArsR/SmtB family transcription factor n=1 Tax=Streptomyces qinglanensis TaxID=943816 RepID=UPI003D706BD8
MPFEIRFGPADPLHCRFALSPVWETQAAVRLLVHARDATPHRHWIRRALPLARSLALEPLRAVLPRRGYTPDFLFPAPAGPASSFAVEIGRVRATDPGRAHAEIVRALADTPGAAESRTARELLGDPAGAVEALAAAVTRAWEALVAPEWPRLRAVLEADIGFRARQLAEGGLARVFAALHPGVSWQEGTLRVDRPLRHTRALAGGEGVTLVPSVFVWPTVAAGFDPPAPAALIYPARGIARLWGAAPDAPPRALARLLGRNRAAVLAALAEPASTSALAARLDLAPSSVSAHLAALRGAGLLASSRAGRQVLYGRTPLGRALAAGRDEGGPAPPGPVSSRRDTGRPSRPSR